MFRLIELVTHWLKRVITQPLQELDRWQMAVRFAYDLGRFGARQLRQDRAQDMAAALAFRTLFGLLPVLVVATVLVKAMGMQQHFLGPLNELFAFWGLDQVQILLPGESGGATETLAVWLGARVREAESVSLAAIGWVGLGLTVYAAISLVVTIEDCFNVIYQAPQGRPWSRRVPLYWFVLTISPVVVVASTYVNDWFEQQLASLHVPPGVTVASGLAWSVGAIWVLMILLYRLFPNAVVRRRPAIIGALVAAILLEIGKRSLGLYLQNALSLSQLYGSLGLIPLFMFWVYLMWLAVLFGLQVSSTLQHLHGRQLAELRQQVQAVVIDPGVVVALLQCIAERFLAGQTASLEQLARATRLPEPVVERLVDGLVQARLLHRVADVESQFALSRPPDQIRLGQLLDFAFAAVDREIGAAPAARWLDQLRAAQKNVAGDATLQSLLGEAAG